MRVMGRLARSHRDERGVTAAITVILLLVMLGFVALAIDGGQLWRSSIGIQNANDAAALAAALKYATGTPCPASATDPNDAAEVQANQTAQGNIANNNAYPDTRGEAQSPPLPAYYVSPCNSSSGQVTVRYYMNQSLEFAPLVGISSPIKVTRKATAQWGVAGQSAAPPFVVTPGQLNNNTHNCHIDVTVSTPQTCDFYYPKLGTGPNAKEWGLLDLAHPPTPPATCQSAHEFGWNVCPGLANVNLANCDESSALTAQSWVGNAPILNLNPSGHTWVCATNGNKLSVWQQLDSTKTPGVNRGQIFCFPLIQAQYPPQVGAVQPLPNAYDVSGFIPLQVVGVAKQGSTNILTVKWLGPQPCGSSSIGTGPNTGSRAIRLIG